MKKLITPVLVLAITITACRNSPPEDKNQQDTVRYSINHVDVRDNFWSPRLEQWRTITVNDVFDKFEGKYVPEGRWLEKDFGTMGETRNAFVNFQLVADGKRGIGKHHGPPWYDGLVYQTIRGASDLIAKKRDPQLEARIDRYIDLIAKAQASEKDNYLNTYTQLMEPDHRWGFNGGMLRWQHDVYNAGMLVEAGIHYYRATGKTKLLNVGVRFANFMYQDMGPAPKKNVVPAHSGPEESFIKLYQLFRDEPSLKSKMNVPVDEKQYWDLATFWLEGRGKHVGLPLWRTWGDQKAEQWIRDVKYDDPKFGDHRRPTWGDYAQDSIPVLEQKTIEGHAVRATLLATALTAAAIETQDPRYIQTANNFWDNMVGRRMFITGGVGAIAQDEKFADDYYLPNNSYLETCAAVGAGFFSQRMNELTGDGKYMDEFERMIFNGVLTGISLSGNKYTYQNPLISDHQHRWGWHDCPCCPPMFLKIMSAVPDFIYAPVDNGIAVNLFIGSRAEITGASGQHLFIEQSTEYPWNGKINLTLYPDHETNIDLKIRIPGWALGTENPFDLYQSDLKGSITIRLNENRVDAKPMNGYVTLSRSWKKGDVVELELPMEPRVVKANDNVKDLQGTVALASGPIVYCFEDISNKGLKDLKIDTASPMEIKFDGKLLNGMNIITGQGTGKNRAKVSFTAVPYYAAGNLKPEDSYKVWIGTIEDK